MENRASAVNTCPSTQRVTGRADDDEGRCPQRQRFAGADRGVEPEDLFRLEPGTGDGEVEIRLQHRQALHMVAVVMGDEDVGERPAAIVEGRFDGAGIGGIDGGGLARLDIVHEIAVIVGAAHEDVDQDRHVCLAPAGC